jgi:hypothetical protein
VRALPPIAPRDPPTQPHGRAPRLRSAGYRRPGESPL